MTEENIQEQEVQEQETPETYEPEAQTEQQSSSKDYNFRALREEKERLQRERDEYYDRIRRYEAQQSSQTQYKAPEPEPEEELDISDDDYIEGKHLKKYIKKLDDKYKKQFTEYQQQVSSQTAETRIKTRYPDFEKVVSDSNVNKLKEIHPELYDSLRSNTDLESKASAAYTLIKKLGIYQEDNFGPDREKAQQNLSKPKPVNTVAQGDSPMSRANAFQNGLTEDVKKSLYAEMMAARKNY